MRWLVDGYNVIRRSPALASREKESLASGRAALCHLLAGAAGTSGDQFTVVFDGAGAGGATSGGMGVRVVFSSARETADRVLARMAAGGGAVVSNDREVRSAAARAGAVAITADDFLERIGRLRAPSAAPRADRPEEKDEDDDRPPAEKKGNPRRAPKKARAAARALGRLGGRG
ncbi:MAG: NYN domain-containing protein [Candidatus Rokubacteria bacterium]|nr:NYN domain-containing protein [Candidatus Rokubacteria bacterium]MBI3105147.1 NYN domain-containing protein [Candidatus Rokubacteria bacterium]